MSPIVRRGDVVAPFAISDQAGGSPLVYRLALNNFCLNRISRDITRSHEGWRGDWRWNVNPDGNSLDKRNGEASSSKPAISNVDHSAGDVAYRVHTIVLRLLQSHLLRCLQRSPSLLSLPQCASRNSLYVPDEIAKDDRPPRPLDRPIISASTDDASAVPPDATNHKFLRRVPRASRSSHFRYPARAAWEGKCSGVCARAGRRTRRFPARGGV
jgi:hypothetical protein